MCKNIKVSCEVTLNFVEGILNYATSKPRKRKPFVEECGNPKHQALKQAKHFAVLFVIN